MQRHPHQRGFTLIELLVVIAVIALLTSILVPSLSGVRDRARTVFCANNLRNIWVGGVMQYALSHNDRLPYLEDINIDDPFSNDLEVNSCEADPFDDRYPTTVGVVLMDYVNPKSWVCPAAVAGYPRPSRPGAPGSPDAENPGPRGSWTMTYTFSVAGPVGKGVPYDSALGANSGRPLDPAVSNYVHFDGRPLALLDGRRYVASRSASSNFHPTQRGLFWNVRRPIISDTLGGAFDQGKPIYPHRGLLEPRIDLGNAQDQFERNSNSIGGGKMTGYLELHADGEAQRTYFTRYWSAHREGF